MPRKKPEAMVALNKIAVKCAQCDADAIVWEDGKDLCRRCYVDNATLRAQERITALGLARRDGENLTAWNRRLKAWLQDHTKDVPGMKA